MRVKRYVQGSDMKPKMTFDCPKCGMPGELPMPEGEVVAGRTVSVASWKNRDYTCPRCLGTFVTQLAAIQRRGQMWVIKPAVEGFEVNTSEERLSRMPSGKVN
jgi:hypothetical protein